MNNGPIALKFCAGVQSQYRMPTDREKQGKWLKKIPCREKSGNLKILFNIRENTGNLKISKKYQGKHREFNFTKNKFY